MEDNAVVRDLQATSLTELLNKNEAACKKFCNDLQTDSYAVIDISDNNECCNLVNSMRQVVVEFFQQDGDKKSLYLCKNDNDVISQIIMTKRLDT